MHIPAGSFAGGEKALQLTGFTGVVRAHAAHGVVHGGTNRHPFLRRVNAQEVMADFVNFAEVVLDVVFAQERDVEPEVFTEAALHTLTLGNTFFHAAGHDVTGSKFLLFRFHVRHEAVAVHVAQQTAVTAAAFRHENTGGENTRGMELNGFHVAQRGNTGFEGERVARTFTDLSVRRHAEELAGAARGDRGGLRDVSEDFTRHQVAADGTVAALAVVNEGEGFHTFHDRDVFSDHAVGHRVQHRMARTVGNVAGTPLLRAAEVALVQKTGGFLAFGDGDLFPVDDDLTVTRGDTRPGHAPGSEFTHGLRARVNEHTHHVLVGTPVGAADRIGEVDVFVVAQALDAVRERSLHTALSRLRVRALRGDERQDDGIMTAALGSNCHTQTGQTATDHQHVGVDNLHLMVSLIREGSALRKLPRHPSLLKTTKARHRSSGRVKNIFSALPPTASVVKPLIGRYFRL